MHIQMSPQQPPDVADDPPGAAARPAAPTVEPGGTVTVVAQDCRGGAHHAGASPEVPINHGNLSGDRLDPTELRDRPCSGAAVPAAAAAAAAASHTLHLVLRLRGGATSIKIQILGGKMMILPVDPAISVWDLKALVEASEKIPIASQRLMFEGKVLADEHRIDFYCSRDMESTILLIATNSQEPAA